MRFTRLASFTPDLHEFHPVSGYGVNLQDISNAWGVEFVFEEVGFQGRGFLRFQAAVERSATAHFQARGCLPAPTTGQRRAIHPGALWPKERSARIWTQVGSRWHRSGGPQVRCGGGGAQTLRSVVELVEKQQSLRTNAEDLAETLSLTESVRVPAGTFSPL
jgi:hypothetical protein